MDPIINAKNKVVEAAGAMNQQRQGRILEVPLSRVVPMVLLMCGISWLGLYVNRKAYGGSPITMTPDWIAASKRIGPVSERTEAPPVFRDPFRHNIPGYIQGPEDLIEKST
jgi:hypothetical protein